MNEIGNPVAQQRIAFHLAGRLPPQVEVDDLIQAGMIGLLESAQHYAAGRGASFEIHTPQRGPKRAMLELAERNAALSFEQRFRILQPSAKMIAEGLQEALDLPEPPGRIECFDISHIQGSDTVASMVVWDEGRMRKSEYRKFIVKTVEGIDDFASMREVVGRRLDHLSEQCNSVLTIASVIGGAFGWLIGYALFDVLALPILNMYGYGAKFAAFQESYREWGLWIIRNSRL